MPTRAQLKSRSRRRRAIGGKIFVKRNRFKATNRSGYENNKIIKFFNAYSITSFNEIW